MFAQAWILKSQVTHAVLTPHLLGNTRIPVLNGSPMNVLNHWKVYHIRLQRQLWLQPRLQPLRQSQRRYRHARILWAIDFAYWIFPTPTEVMVMILQTIHSKHIAVGIDPLIWYRWMLPYTRSLGWSEFYLKASAGRITVQIKGFFLFCSKLSRVVHIVAYGQTRRVYNTLCRYIVW